MKIALISDIHGNSNALETVLEDINNHHIETIICLGDVATIGPQPKQVIDRLKRLDCSFIMGNHDEALLNPERIHELKIAPPLISSIHWCLEQLSNDDLDFLNTFKSSIKFPFGNNKELLCFHGSPKSNTELIISTTSSEELDSSLLSDNSAAVFAGGHSHIQMLRQHNGRIIINPGSIGHPFQNIPEIGIPPTLLPWAEYAIINYQNDYLSADLKRVNFDINAFSEIVAKTDIPIRDWLLQQYNS